MRKGFVDGEQGKRDCMTSFAGKEPFGNCNPFPYISEYKHGQPSSKATHSGTEGKKGPCMLMPQLLVDVS